MMVDGNEDGNVDIYVVVNDDDDCSDCFLFLYVVLISGAWEKIWYWEDVIYFLCVFSVLSFGLSDRCL